MGLVIANWTMTLHNRTGRTLVGRSIVKQRSRELSISLLAATAVIGRTVSCRSISFRAASDRAVNDGAASCRAVS